MKKGYIYIMTNEFMPNIIKIGKTTDLQKRLNDLYKTSVPAPFQLEYAVEVEDCDKIERLIHDDYDKDRINPKREFFKLEVENAISMLKLTGGKEVTINMYDKTVDEEGKEIRSDAFRNKAPKMPSTNFEILKLPPNTILNLARDEKVTCKVVDNKKVEYNGKIYSLSDLTIQLFKEKFGSNSNHMNGYRYWKYNDQTYGNEILTERRERLENENIEDEE